MDALAEVLLVVADGVPAVVLAGLGAVERSSPPRGPISTIQRRCCASRAADRMLRWSRDQISGRVSLRPTKGLSLGTEPSGLMRTLAGLVIRPRDEAALHAVRAQLHIEKAALPTPVHARQPRDGRGLLALGHDDVTRAGRLLRHQHAPVREECDGPGLVEARGHLGHVDGRARLDSWGRGWPRKAGLNSGTFGGAVSTGAPVEMEPWRGTD